MRISNLFIFLAFLSSLNSTFSQSTKFGDDPVQWATNALPDIPSSISSIHSDLIILDERTEFLFFSKTNEKISRSVIIKINSNKGAEISKSFKLPESFDIGYDAFSFVQGRRSRIKTPMITEYTVTKFGARKFSNGIWTNVSFNVKYEQIKGLKYTGEFYNDELTNFNLIGISNGDILEIYYESNFNSNYGNNLFYFNSIYPKLNCEYIFNYAVSKSLLGYSFILPICISDSFIQNKNLEGRESVLMTKKIKLKNLKGINYPVNCQQGNNLPHVFLDFTVYRSITNSYPTGDDRIYDYKFVRPKNFEWRPFDTDTTNSYTKIYDKNFAALRKFLASLPPTGNDSANVVFFKSLCDTLNNFRYITPNQLFYNESNLYDLSSGEHLLKRRLSGMALDRIYQNILNENKVFYYVINIQHNKLGEHNSRFRAHYAYEDELIAVPNKNSYIYFMPRYAGVKYHLNELPFYFEGSLGAMTPYNFQEKTKNKDSQFLKFIKTHKGTFNENTRTENGTVKISLDSLKADLTIKESLSGQFSTLLRHLYLNELIDSTVTPHYYKKCLDKPNAINQKTKLSSKITEFPFRYTFNCSEKIKFNNDSTLNLKNWFSFIVSKKTLPEIPNHDYYFDFDFSDSYNLLLDFNKPVEITNSNKFIKNTNNEWFELQSEIVKNSETNYLLKAKVIIKQMKIPEAKLPLLMNLVNDLEELNDFSLSLIKR